jgi:hypothetical protein
MVSLVAAEGEFGQCLYNITIPVGGRVVCDPPGTLPQSCTVQCAAGFWAPQANAEMTCMNAQCQNRCQAVQKTCVGSVPVRHNGPDGAWTDYVREERPCCALEKAEAAWCDLGACTGNCVDPGAYVFESVTCPDVCVPFRDVEPVWQCKPCMLPTMTGVVMESHEPGVVSLRCPDGHWGASATLRCGPDGAWGTLPNLGCRHCAEAPYPIEEIDGDMLEVEVGAGYVKVRCRPEYAPMEWTFACDASTGEWPYWEEFACYEPPSPSATPTESPLIPSATPSPSKSPRAAKVKGSRAPTQPPKMRGSRLPGR